LFGLGYQNMTFDTSIIRSNNHIIIIIQTYDINDGPKGEVDIVNWIE